MWKMIAVPVVGAVIGYITNWIAVKMLFRPRYEKKIGGMHVPFTPGIIPKGQPRLAKAIGKAVETQILTPKVMREMLLSDDTKRQLSEKIDGWLAGKKAENTSIKEAALHYMDQESWKELKLFLAESASDILSKKLIELDLGKLITAKLVEAVNEKLADSMLGIMLGGGMLDSIASQAEVKINEYIANNSEEYLIRIFAKEMDSFEEKTTGQILTSLEENGFQITSLVVGIYENILEEHIDGMVQSLKLSEIVEKRINDMKVEEVEELVLTIMKKELGAVVNLGAVIGFLLGLINVAILMI